MAAHRISLLSILALAASQAAAQAPAAALKAISEQGLLNHIKVLASDDFEGRAPGSEGERKTVAYLEQQFKQLGLKPGNPDGTYVQNVPMRGMTATPTFRYTVAGKTVPLTFPDDYVAHSTAVQTTVDIPASDIVFVGYGVQAPEYGWDDYKGADLKGKTLLMLINDPAIPDPLDPSQLDQSMFRGAAMTYYGRWTYKYEMAARLGAAAALIIHETKPAAYPYDVVKTGGAGEHFSLLRDGPDPDAPTIPGWIHLDRAKELLAAAGYDFDTLKQAALRKDFKPVALNAKAGFHVENQARVVQSRNVVAKIDGSDPGLKNDVVIYTAHWDHFGIDEKLPGPRSKQIYHGALDNASGTAALLQLAKAYKALPKAPRRTMVFIATTAEEQGLLGAQYYAKHPLYPLNRTLADINIDGVNAWGKTSHIENVTSGHTTMDELLAKYAALQGRAVQPDSRPELGSVYRADQLEFARVGVPALYTRARSNYLNRPADYARKVVDHYVANDYHKVTDDVRTDWDFSGGVQDIQLLFQVGYDIAQGKAWPQWKPGSEFNGPPRGIK